ncbi:Mce protein [Mycolicibacter kumamotonensis]|uniref:Mce protein n=1 Tax=Mycolicibacter kumamotonensis TaxID=354243 RepID=UPI001F246EEA|nr:Mce protein [Mycolicibacter kumamotonensis]
MSKRTPATSVFDKFTEPDCRPEDSMEADSDVPDDTDTATTEPGGRKAGATPPNRPRQRLIAIAVGVVLIAALGSSAYFGWRVRQLDDTAMAGQSALAAARAYAVVLTTLDADDIDKHYTQALDGATGAFKDAYSQGAAHLRQILIANKAAGNGVVLDAAIKSATKTKVEVLLFVDQSVSNAVTPGPRLDRNRVQMTMELVENRWLASQVDLI